MPRRLVVTVLALAGCDHAFGIAPIAPDAPRPGYIAPGDLDGDGVPNDQDPCPLDPDQSHAVNDDRDGDGLGDGCDPDLNGGAPDCIVLLDSFVGHPLVWTIATAGLAVGTCDGREGLCASTTDPQVAYLADLPPIAELDAEIYLSLVSGQPVDALQVTTTLAAETNHTVSARACGAGKLGTLPVVAVTDLDHDSPAQVAHVDATDFQINAAQEFSLRWTPSSDTCSATNGGHTHVVTAASPLPPAGTAVGLRLVGVHGAITQVLAYGSRCAP